MSEYSWSPGMVVNGVLFGRSSHLFLAQGAHSVLDYATGKKKLESGEVEIFHDNLLSRYELCRSMSVSYMHAIMPDKHSVVKSEFPLDSNYSIAAELRSQIGTVGDKVYYAADILANVEDVYKRTDTHLTDKGTIMVVCDLVEKITGRSSELIRANLLSKVVETRAWAGDLGSKLEPPLSVSEVFYKDEGKTLWLHNGLTGANNGIVDIYISNNPIFLERALIFGDSFGREICRFLGQIFSEVIFLRTPFFHEEIISMNKPDIVITESVERYLENGQRDDARGSFFMIPYLGSGEYKCSSEFARAFSALLSYPRLPYREFLRNVKATSVR